MVKGRKITGGKYKMFRKKRKYSLPGTPRKVKLRQIKKKIIRGMGGNKKTVLLSTEFVNIIDIIQSFFIKIGRTEHIN